MVFIRGGYCKRFP